LASGRSRATKRTSASTKKTGGRSKAAKSK
jgi:hypothetical protein